MKKQNAKISAVILLLLVIALLGLKFYKHTRSAIDTPSAITSIQANEPVTETASQRNHDIPQKVYDVLHYIQQHHEAPEGYVGGRAFKNLEHHLENKTSDGRKIHYHEWDVNPKVRGHNRGTERLITGDDGRTWYTNNHYKTFKEVR